MEISSKSQAENGTDNNTIMTPLRVKQSIAANAGGGGGGTSDYSSLVNKPQINNITLEGNKTGAQLGLASSSDIPTKTSDLQNDSNFAVTNANNNFSATQRFNSTIYSQASYIEKGGGLGLRATGPVPGPVTNETGAITFYQWREEEPDVYTEITKAKINVANVLDLTNCNPYYVAYDENGNQLVSSQLALMSDIPTRTSDIYNDSGYLSSIPTMYGFLSNSVSITSGTYTEINTLSSYFNNTNGKLSISNGKIKVGSGVSLIKVSFTIGLDCSQDTLYSYLTKNGTSTGLWLVKSVNGAYDSVFREDLIDVIAGDEISCNVYLGSGGTVAGGARTNYTVEVLG